MQAPTPMAHEELLELAALDALGLLDQYETALFTRSFHRASVAVQKQIIEFQAELAADETLLPDEEPTPELRTRVLNAVADAVEAETADLAPLATFTSRPDRAMEPTVVSNRRSRFTALFWRAAVLVLTVALVIVSYFGSQAMRFNNQLSRAAFSDKTLREFEDVLGPSFAAFVGHPACRTVRFNAVDPEFEGSLTMYINEKTNEALLVAMSLPDTGEPYTIVSELNGRTRTVRSFDTQGPIVGVYLQDVSDVVNANASWGLRNSSGAVVMRGS